MPQHSPAERLPRLLYAANARRVQDALRPKPFPIY